MNMDLVWCLVTHKDNFTFTLPLHILSLYLTTDTEAVQDFPTPNITCIHIPLKKHL